MGQFNTYRTKSVCMDTVVAIEVVFEEEKASRLEVEVAVEEAMHHFYEVEQSCSRFDPNSEVMRLRHRVGEPTVVSPILFEALRFALAVADMTDGRFDPTIGGRLETLGFNRHYLTGETRQTHGAPIDATYRDIVLEETQSAVTLLRPVIIDLGAVAKGLAVDLAARQLASFPGVVVDAGGDVFAIGVRADAQPWRIGIRHPREQDVNMMILQVRDMAVCTSGDYERRSPLRPDVHHIVQPGAFCEKQTIVSSSVIAPYAMMADALSTAAFLLGPEAGIELLSRCEVDGMLVGTDGQIYTTDNLEAYLHDQ